MGDDSLAPLSATQPWVLNTVTLAHACPQVSFPLQQHPDFACKAPTATSRKRKRQRTEDFVPPLSFSLRSHAPCDGSSPRGVKRPVTSSFSDRSLIGGFSGNRSTEHVTDFCLCSVRVGSSSLPRLACTEDTDETPVSEELKSLSCYRCTSVLCRAALSGPAIN